MAKTHHRRRPRRANRSRRGGVKSNPASAAPRPATHEDLKAIFGKVDALAAQATPQKISKPQTQSAIENEKMKKFKKILLTGKATHSKGKSYKHTSGVVDPFVSQQYVHNGR